VKEDWCGGFFAKLLSGVLVYVFFVVIIVLVYSFAVQFRLYPKPLV